MIACLLSLGIILLFLIGLLVRNLVFGPGIYIHEILKALRDGRQKPLEEIQSHVRLKPNALQKILFSMEYNYHYIVSRGSNGNPKCSRLFSITRYGERKFDNFVRLHPDRS